MFFESGPSSSSSSSSSKSGWTYDVFLSFRGEDTRKNFTDHLYTALLQAGIHTFRDDDDLPRGQEIFSQLCQAIQRSKISIVVFSKGYASSRWCLDELEEILDCKHRNTDQIVLPIFYDIDPSDVRKQTGSFKEAFDGHEKLFKKEKVNKWREMLLEVGHRSGWNLKDMADGHESKFIQMIVEEVSKDLDNKRLHMAKFPVGIDSRVHDIVDLINIGTNDVYVVGIYGMPGVGKTTIAKAIFNQLYRKFEGCCFLFNVKDNGIVQLQEQLLCEILKDNVSKICDEHRGINLIEERLCHRRVLVVVDDVDHREQLEALVGEKSWFGLGSIIIITTRDERLLTHVEVNKKFKVGELNKKESLQLFRWHAFRDSHPSKDWLGLSNAVVKYCRGLPLALEVLGSYLFRRSETEWKSAIERLQKIPHGDIQKKLKLSFDALDDDIKHVFLDISCFFVGRGREYVAKILHARCGFEPEINIITLIERSLLTIDHRNKLMMHDLLRDVGREIVRQMSPQNPGRRSRIWFHDDALDVLKKHMGTKIVEGLAIDVRAADVSFVTESFTNMRRLQLLQIDGVQLVGSYEHLSKDLIWLCWLECPLKYLPSNFLLDNIAVLDIQHSNLIELWKEIKCLNTLKILDLSHSKYLTKTPNFVGLSNLERLILEDCPSLVEIHQSIGLSKRLVFLNLKRCCRLRNLPQSICDLNSLETLNLDMCSQLEKLPDCLGDLESLTELLVDETAIMLLPSSIGNLKNLKKLSFGGCNYKYDAPSAHPYAYWFLKLLSWVWPTISSSKALLPASFVGLTSLTDLNLSNRSLSESEISSIDLGSLCCLKELNLSGNKFFNLPSGIGRLPKLEFLWVNQCSNLQSISGIPSSLNFLNASYCTSLERISLPSKTELLLDATRCQHLAEIQGFEADASKWEFDLAECNNLSDNFKQNLLQACGEDYDIVVVGGQIPQWFSHHEEGSSVSFQIPTSVSDGVLVHALLVWVVFAADEVYDIGTLMVSVIVENKTKVNRWFERDSFVYKNRNYNKHSWISQMALAGLPFQMEAGDELELRASVGPGRIIERCGVHLIVKKADEEARWKSHLTREMLHQSQICSVSSKLTVGYSIGQGRSYDRYYWASPDEESGNCLRVNDYRPIRSVLLLLRCFFSFFFFFVL